MGTACGWASHDEQFPLEIQITDAGGAILAEGIADQPRSDLGGKRVGFRILLPAHILKQPGLGLMAWAQSNMLLGSPATVKQTDGFCLNIDEPEFTGEISGWLKDLLSYALDYT